MMLKTIGRVQAGGRWGVAVSGGGDSVALLHLLLEQEIPAERLVVLHYHHGWSEAADGWAAGVEALAQRLGVACVTGKGTRGRAETNAEEVAREDRLAWFAEMCAAYGLAGVMTGHTRTDQVEQLLMRLGRGSGLRGLAGMQIWNVFLSEKGEFGILRPLLSNGREDLRAYLREKGESWVEDPSNGGSYRGRIRALLPLLEQAGVGEEAVAASVGHLGRSEASLNGVAEGVFSELVLEGPELAVDLPRFRELNEEFALRVLSKLGHEVTGYAMAPRTSKRQALWRQIAAQEQGVATLGGCIWRWQGRRLVVEREG